MVPGFASDYRGESPRFEVWYGKVDVGPGRALWFRYTTFDGALREASTWAIVFDGDETFGGRSYFEIEDLAPPNEVIIPEGSDPSRFRGHEQVFHTDGAHLDEANAIGEAAGVEWDLTWADSGRRFRFLPTWFGPMLSTYDSCFLDLEISGTISFEGTTWEVDSRPGMVAHIRGPSFFPEHWAWVHCNNFADDEDAVFEGLTVKATFGVPLPTLTECVLYVDGREYPFGSPLSVVRTRSEFDRNGWTFEARAGGARLTGRAKPPDRSRIALVEYDDTDGSNLWCYNSKLADLELRLEDLKRGTEYELRAEGTSAYEYMTRDEPDEEPLF